nr:RNA-directed DNA polymerase, eukaryota [Tanacetum cinerariifolium]
MYGMRGALDRSHSLPARNSPWIDIIREVKRLSLKESSGEFSMKSIRYFIDDSLLPKADVPTRWVKVVPIKINIFGWRVSLDKLLTRCSHCHCHHILRMVTDLRWLSFADGACPSFRALAVSVKDMTKDSGDSSKKEISTTSTPQFQCPMLKPSNYSLWEIRMQIILEANGLSK